MNESESCKKFLGIWHLTADGNGSVPVAYNELCNEITQIGCDVPAHKVIRTLEANGWIETNVHGERILSEAGIAERKQVKSLRVVPAPADNDESKWTDFRNLCRYYAACTRCSERSENPLFLDDLNNTFLFPPLVGNWFGSDEPQRIIRSRANSPAFSYISTLGGPDGRQAYLGYPIWSFVSRRTGQVCLNPVILFPVDIRFDELSGETFIEIHNDEAELNATWLDRNFGNDRDERRQIEHCAMRQHDGSLNLPKTLQALENRFRQKQNVNLVPADLSTSSAFGHNRLNNAAVLFLESESKYSKVFLRELRQISREPAETLNRTALRFVFKNPPDPISRGNDVGEILGTADAEIFPEDLLATKNEKSGEIENCFNREQISALVEALNLPVSKLQGPPGTGKSQVAAGLIANLVLRGRSVLFTSKNRKAVAAIYERCTKIDAAQKAEAPFGTLFPPLVRFCIMPDGSAGGDNWAKGSEDNFPGLANPTDWPSTPDSFDFSENDNFFRHWTQEREKIRRIDRSRDALAAAEIRFGERARKLFGEGPQSEEIGADKIRFCLEILREANFPARVEEFRKKQNRFFFRIFRKRRFAKHLEETEKELKSQFPKCAENVGSRERFCEKIAAFTQALENLQKLSAETAALRADLEEAESAVPAERRKDFAGPMKDEAETAQKMLLSARLKAAREIVPAGKAQLGNEEKLRAKRAEEIRNIFWKWANRKPLPFERSMPLGKDSEERAFEAELLGAFRDFTRISPAWAATLLSLSHASPCIPAAFDRVIIDEAAQCDIPPIIPALFRAKGVTIIGDPMQFPPVITLNNRRNLFLIEKYKIDGGKWDFCKKTAYDVVARERRRPIILRDQWRSREEIVNYGNAGFYNGILTARAKWSTIPPGMARALDWIETDENDDAEDLAAVRERLREIAKSGFAGTVGIISPLRKIVDALQEMLGRGDIPADELPPSFQNREKIQENVNTVHGFQGGERDMIIYVLGINASRKRGEIWYIDAPENDFVHNVAVSRARLCCAVVGNRERVMRGNDKIVKLAELATRTPQKRPQEFGSIWEEKLFNAIRADKFFVGKTLKPQYPLRGRWLDIALVEDKIDIEVDGVRWHMTARGQRKADDFYRDITVEAAGWRPCRFWVSEIRERPDDCLAELRRMVKTGSPQQPLP